MCTLVETSIAYCEREPTREVEVARVGTLGAVALIIERR